MKSYHVHKVPDSARHLSACPPRQQQYPSSLRGLRGKKKKRSCFQTLRPFFLCGSTRTDEISSRRKNSTNCNDGHKPWIMYDGAEHEAHILDCSEVITGGWRILVGHWFCYLFGNQILLAPVCIAHFANPPDFGKI